MNMAVDPAKAAAALELASVALPPRKPRGQASRARWHIAHTVGVSDQHVLDWLKRFEIEYYYPHLRELRPVPKAKLSRRERALGVPILRPKIIPLLPRYIFVRFDMGAQSWREEFETAGIGGLARADGEDRSGHYLPVEISDEQIGAIRGREVDGAIPGATPLWELLSIGDRVKITGGPLLGHVGPVDRIRRLASDKFDSVTRIRIVIALFGQDTPVELEADQIERVADDE